MCARRALVNKIARLVNSKHFCVHSCLTRTRCSKPPLQVSVELPSDDRGASYLGGVDTHAAHDRTVTAQSLYMPNFINNGRYD